MLGLLQVYFHGHQDFGFVFSWIAVRTIQKTVSTQTCAIYEYSHYACNKIPLQSSFENNTIAMLDDILKVLFSYVGTWFQKSDYRHNQRNFCP